MVIIAKKHYLLDLLWRIKSWISVVAKDFSLNSADYTLTIFPSHLKETVKDNIPSFQLTLSKQSKIRVILSKLALLGSSTWLAFILMGWYKQNKRHVNVQTVLRTILFSVLMKMVRCITQQGKVIVRVLLLVVIHLTKRVLQMKIMMMKMSCYQPKSWKLSVLEKWLLSLQNILSVHNCRRWGG